MTKDVAVIGAGPSGLVAARWLLQQGFEPTIFEQGPMVGGQWTGLDGRSGVWPSMHTNSSRTLTAFSDLEHTSDHVYLSNREVLDYLHRYADTFGLTPRIRLGTRVELISSNGVGWVVTHAGTDEHFDRIVVASGRFHAPAIPAAAGLETFSGSAGAISTYHYRDGLTYRDKRVLIAGCAISALEIASEVAELGAARVVVTQRRQRYIAPKFAAGVPSDNRLYTRYGALATEALTAADVDQFLKEIVVGAAGSPGQYGAPAPDPSLSVAGVTLSQHYLPLVAEGRISVRRWMRSVAGPTVTFADERAEDFDGIVFGTGYQLCLPFLSEDIRAVLDLDAVHMNADRYTFHPDLPGLAFMGLWDQSGGYFVPLELQARWIAYTWGGTIPPISANAQRSAIDAYRAGRGTPQKTRMDLAALTFARAAGVEPDLNNWPQLRRALLFGPLAPSCFRLEGPDALPDAPERFARDAARFGAITSNDMTEREQRDWLRVRAAAPVAGLSPPGPAPI
ncbi:flavin-containing monooxygenase [Mycobacterium sp. pR1184]|uniref:flavin-containing monooxygenase n=1 Tax=Mycobacterium sp. pR1184 TaxID=3238981 RepID=UPI00351B9FBF